MSETIYPAAQSIIDRLAAHSWKRGAIDRSAVENAITDHLHELGLPALPFRWFATAKAGYEAAWSAARSAAWSAARSAAESAAWSAARSDAESAARSAAWSAARSAAWSAAEVNALGVFNHPAHAKLAAIWLPMIDAFNAGLWLYWITPTEVLCVEQPSLYISDNSLHREDGPAVEWPAGESYCFWRGTQVPNEWITDRASLDAKTALTWPHIEQRRAACEMIGWHRVLAALRSKTIDKHSNPQIGELVEVLLPDAGKARFLRVRCGTMREFALPVPPTVKTAIEAQAWTWGIDAKEFKTPEVRT